MADPTLSMTFEDFILRVSEYLGVSSYAGTIAAIPTDAHDLDVCKRLVNDGFRRFYNSNHNWNWVNQEFSITFDPDGTSDKIVNGEIWRYYMPDGFYGHMIGGLTYSENSGQLMIQELEESIIRDRYAISDVSGYPSEYAIRPIAADVRGRWEVVFWPKPSENDTVIGRCRIYPNKLVELTDKPSCGFQFDEAILAASLAMAETMRGDASSLMETQWTEALARAVAMDRGSSPSRLGDFGGSGIDQIRPYTGVDSYTNLDGTVHTF